MSVYVAPEVADVLALHPYLHDTDFRRLPIRQQLGKQADILLQAHQSGDRRVAIHILSWWPEARNRRLDDIMAAGFSRSDARQTMAREYGFADWDTVNALDDLTPDLSFEIALDEMLAGDAGALRIRLEREPHLASARSHYGHQATLLHYIGANGVESHRQVTPLNAAQLARLLISFGASIEAEANMYGGGQNPLALASSSAHPHAAGISDELNRILGG